MSTFFMFGKYSSQSVGGISGERTKKAAALVKELGGKIGSMYTLLGEHDLVLIVDLPGIKEAMKASVAMNRATGIAFTTCPAVTVEEFDKMMA